MSLPSYAEGGGLDNIKDRINKIRSQLSSEESKKNRIQLKLQESEQRIIELRRKITVINSEKRAITNKITAFRDRQEMLLEKKRRHQKVLAEQLRSAYKSGKESKIKLLLNQQEPEKVGRLLSYHKYLNIAREKKINELQGTIEEMKTVREQIKDEVWQLSLKEEALEREQQVLVKENSLRKNLMSQINSNIDTKSRNLKQLIADRRKLSNLIDKMDAPSEKTVSLGNSDFAKNKGNMRWPVRGKVSKSFGSRITGDLRREGIVINASQGSAVRAIHSGKVVFADWFQNKGLMVIINHGNGYMSLYAHNKSILNQVGDQVDSGEKIAISGKTGNVQQPALYFEIRKDSTPLNPSKWLK